MGQVMTLCASDEADEHGYDKNTVEKYKVTGRSGATVRSGEPLDSPIQCTLTPGTIVEVTEVKGRRCCIVNPVKGWGSIATENGYVIIEPLSARPRYRVVYPEGVIVRSAADIDDSDFVRVISRGEIVEGTGQVQMFDNVERVQVADGWISMRLREDDGALGDVLLEKI
ncbi:unnamed protein product [Ectocarpus sp. 6 AP-2014]